MLVGKNVTRTPLAGEFDVQFDRVGNRADIDFGIDNQDALGALNVRTGHSARTLDANLERDGLGGDHLELIANRDVLDVEQELGCVFLHAGDRRELMENLVDAHRSDGGTLDRAQQNAAKGIADRLAVAALKRLQNELAFGGVQVECLDVGHILSVSPSPARVGAGKSNQF